MASLISVKELDQLRNCGANVHLALMKGCQQDIPAQSFFNTAVSGVSKLFKYAILK